MRKLFLSFTLLAGFTLQANAADNYAATAGSGLTFGAKDAAGVLYSRFIGCDNTTVSQCWAIDASGRQAVAMSSGSVASGAFASGSIAAGAMVDLLTMRGTVTAGTAAANSLLTGCIYNSTPITLSNGQGAAVQCSVNGYPTVVVSNTLAALTPGDGITTGTYASGSPVLGGTLLWNSTTYDRWKSVATGVAAVGGTGTAGTAASNVLTVQGIASMTPLAENITQVLGSPISATNGLFTNVLQGNAALSTTNGLYSNLLQGNAVLSITNPTFNRPVATATGGGSTTGNIVANNTTAVVVKGSAGTLYGAQLYGIGSAPAYLKIYNATSATCGSGTPVKRLMIPAASTAANGAGSNIAFGDVGVDFSTGITYCVTTGIADNDTTAPAASTYLVNLDWK